jgi:hypothetical protein
LLSSEHFSVDGALIEAWGLDEEFQAKGPADKQRTERRRAQRAGRLQE